MMANEWWAAALIVLVLLIVIYWVYKSSREPLALAPVPYEASTPKLAFNDSAKRFISCQKYLKSINEEAIKRCENKYPNDFSKYFTCGMNESAAQMHSCMCS